MTLCIILSNECLVNNLALFPALLIKKERSIYRAAPDTETVLLRIYIHQIISEDSFHIFTHSGTTVIKYIWLCNSSQDNNWQVVALLQSASGPSSILLFCRLAFCCCIVTKLCLCLSFPSPSSSFAPHILYPSPTFTLSSRFVNWR